MLLIFAFVGVIGLSLIEREMRKAEPSAPVSAESSQAKVSSVDFEVGQCATEFSKEILARLKVFSKEDTFQTEIDWVYTQESRFPVTQIKWFKKEKEAELFATIKFEDHVSLELQKKNDGVAKYLISEIPFLEIQPKEKTQQVSKTFVWEVAGQMGELQSEKNKENLKLVNLSSYTRCLKSIVGKKI